MPETELATLRVSAARRLSCPWLQDLTLRSRPTQLHSHPTQLLPDLDRQVADISVSADCWSFTASTASQSPTLVVPQKGSKRCWISMHCGNEF
eukprot:2104172-Rhodomonas_salina.2